MVATSHPEAVAAALEILRAGGNAVDAGVAAAAVLCVAEPQMTGLGGDAWAVYAPGGATLSAQSPPVVMNASGRAPAAIDTDALTAQFGDEQLFPIPAGSAHSVTVPTAVAGLCALHEQYGALELAQTLRPAIVAADEGVPVAPRVRHDWLEARDALVGVARDWHLPGGEVPPLGAKVGHRGVADVLRRVAAGGPQAFYEGEVAEDMVASLRALGGAHTLDDFAAARADFTAPATSRYRDWDLWTPLPSGQGVVALLILDILAKLDIGGLPPFGADRLHLEAEAVSRAYAARDVFLGDDPSALDALRDPALADRLAADIDPQRRRPTPEIAPIGTPRHAGDTVLVTVVDRDGGALSLIMSIFGTFGSGLASEKFGLLFHNRGGAFTLRAGHPNRLAPGKRPMHTLIPALASVEGRPRMVFGVMGGQYQAAGVARLVSNIRDYGLSLQDAIDAPRSFPYPSTLQIESGVDDGVLAALAGRGHDVERVLKPTGGAQAIMIAPQSGVRSSGSDPRKDGMALGF